MKTFDKQLLDKFFDGSCSPGQAEEVMDWLDTSTGQEYLDKRLQDELEEWEIDGDKTRQNEKSSRVSDTDPLNSTLLFKKIMLSLGWNSLLPKRRLFIKPIIQIAATLLVIGTATLFYIHSESSNGDSTDLESVTYLTNYEHQKQITLRDGSEVRLNENSSLTIDQNYNRGERKVTLTGEAFFDVFHNPEKPFIVYTDRSVIEVLGTSFNVKLNSDHSKVGVAVTDGRVSLRHSGDGEDRKTLLEKGQFASLNTITREIYIDGYGIDNYLVWKSGRLVFEQLTMLQVCTQLNRIYGLTCDFVGDGIQNRKLTANFSSTSVEKTLSVIAETLDLRYEVKDKQVVWYRNL